jgi:ABC-type sugar transport system ATPase subunit
VRTAAELLGLSGLLDRYPKTLSGGERQRTALGRAIVREPRLFLFDEPLSNLDYQLRNRMRGELVSLQRSLKKTVIYVTHDQTEGMTMADTLVLMDKGRIRQIGAPGDLYRYPADLFVAGFIGAPPMNIFPARCRNGSLAVGDYRVELESLRLPDGAYQIGIRPGDLRACEPDTGFHMLVDHSEFHGSENYIFGTHGDVHLTARGELGESYQWGDKVALAFDIAALHVFDSQTGERLSGLDSSPQNP